MSDKKPEAPMIRFGGQWSPAHEIWKKMETATFVAAAIERFNAQFPNLSSSETRDVVPLVRQRLKDIELRMPSTQTGLPDLSPVAADLLTTQTPERALQVLREAHGIKLDLQQLLQLVGERPYIDALTREADDYRENRVSPEQTARLWNEAGRPGPGGGLWTAHKVDMLLRHRI